MYVGGDVVAIDGRLTRVGCRRFVIELWESTGRVVSGLRDPSEALGWDGDVLGGVVRDALPTAGDVGAAAWLVLVEVARLMVVWRVEAGCEE